MSRQQAAQLGAGEVGGVDGQIGARPQRGDQAALGSDAVGDPPVGRQRVRPPGLGEAALQYFVVAVEKQQGGPGAGAEAVELVQERPGREAAAADVDAQRDRPALPGHGAQEVERQVVDRLVAQVLEDLERGRAAGPGEPGHQYHRTRAVGLGRRTGGPGGGRGGALGALGEAAQGQVQLGRRRGREGIQRQAWQLDTENLRARRVGQARDLIARDQVDDQRDWCLGQARHLRDAQAPDLEHAGDLGRRARDQPGAGGAVLDRHLALVVGDQARPAVDQAQRQVRLARPRGTAQQHAEWPVAAVERDAGGVQEFRAHGAPVLIPSSTDNDP